MSGAKKIIKLLKKLSLLIEILVWELNIRRTVHHYGIIGITFKFDS